MNGAIELLRTRTELRPKVAVVLGSGLGAFAEGLAERVEVPYSEIPGWPQSTAVGHAGKLVFGLSGATPVMVMAGRAHLYEGYTPAQVVFGVRVLAGLGVRTIVFTNAAGGINLEYERGGLVLISDHINLQGSNPLVGPDTRFPDMTEAYPAALRRTAKEVAAKLGIPLREGVYVGLLGPSFETPAEIRFLRTIGADLVGMSTVLEVIAANDLGLRVLAISCITNMAAGVLPQKITHEEVLATGDMVRDTLARFLTALVARIEE
jgi:purine-nucleoside phosphorylase